MNKKGQAGIFDNLSGAAIGFVTVALVFVIGFIMVDNLDDNLTAGTTGVWAANNVTAGMSNVTEQLPLLGLVIGLAAVFIVALGVFSARRLG